MGRAGGRRHGGEGREVVGAAVVRRGQAQIRAVVLAAAHIGTVGVLEAVHARVEEVAAVGVAHEAALKANMVGQDKGP